MASARNKLSKIRLAVFKIWFLTLGVILLVFAEKLSGIRDMIPPPFAATFQSLQMMTGLVVPQIGVMAAFYLNLDRQEQKIAALSDEQITIIVWLSLTYHCIFIVCVLFGISAYGFDHSADGHALERNTAAVVAVMGLFSVFLAPVAFLFARTDTKSPNRTVGPMQDRSSLGE